MTLIDVIVAVLLAVAGGIGLLQGLTMILVRAAVVWLGVIALKWIQPWLAGQLEPHMELGSDLAAMVIGFLGLMVLQQLVAWAYRKMRDALMLAWPDRLLGLAAGLLVAGSLVVVSAVYAARSSESMAKSLAESRSGPWIAKCEPLVDRFLTPERLEKGQKKLQEWVDEEK